MLYRHKQGTFEVCPFKATYTVIKKEVVEDGVEVIELPEGGTEEVPKYKTVEVEESQEAFVHDKERFERTLSNSSIPFKNLIYSDFSLTEEEENRFKEVRNLPEKVIGSAMEYIKTGVYPKELEVLKLGRELAEKEINEIIMGQQISELEIMILGGSL